MGFEIGVECLRSVSLETSVTTASIHFLGSRGLGRVGEGEPYGGAAPNEAQRANRRRAKRRSAEGEGYEEGVLSPLLVFGG